MAADILLYGAGVVPVGDDQLQHLELTRTLARKFNSKFGKVFIEPKDLLTKTSRVMSLKDPEKKMSKSQPEGCLFLDDTPKDIAGKIARAVTDSDGVIAYDPKTKPGLSNLLEIYGALTHQAPELVAKEFSGEQYSVLKKKLTELIAEYFAEFREKKTLLLEKSDYLKKILADGSTRAGAIAEARMAAVKKQTGLAL
jgi:tryptophanyl-tRNA synthetase